MHSRLLLFYSMCMYLHYNYVIFSIRKITLFQPTLAKKSVSLEDHCTLALVLKYCKASMSMVGNIPKIVGSLQYLMELVTVK